MHTKISRRPVKRSSFARVESLEGRQLLSVTLGTNAVVNGDAESNTGSASGDDVITPTGWTVNSTPTVVKYGADGFPTATDPGPSSRGKNFFAGGPDNSESDLFQSIDVSAFASAIDAHQIKYTLSGFLGGFSDQTDNATLFANFQGAVFSQAFVGPVTPTDRGSATGMLSRSTQGTLPAGTRTIQVQLHFEGGQGSYDDGYADNISLVLTSAVSQPGSVAGTVFNDANGDGSFQAGEAGLGNVSVFVDKNKNGILDSGEPNVKTAANGTYKIGGLAAGSYSLREVVPGTFRATTANPLAITITSGGALTGKAFGDSQTGIISGSVFNDANGNKVRDASEKGIAGVTVYLDFNSNGQLDSFELKTVTDSAGNFKFVLPFGTYVVREVVPTGKVQTTPAGGITVSLAKAQIVSTLKFGDK